MNIDFEVLIFSKTMVFLYEYPITKKVNAIKLAKNKIGFFM